MTKEAPVALPDGFVEFYEEVETWQNELFFRLKRNITIEKIDAIPLLKKENLPLLEFIEFEVNVNDYRDAFLAFAGLVKARREKSASFIDQLLKAKEKLNYGQILDRLLRNDRAYFIKMSEETGVPVNILMLIAQHAARPFLRIFALPYEESLGKNEEVIWDKGICPVCGAIPSMSRVRSADGRRFLFCEECFTEWEHRYLACIYCGNDEPSTIKYFVVDGDEANQVFVCDKCKGYLKNYDERKGKAHNDMFITSVKTIYLDLLAEQRGYGQRDSSLN